MAELADARDLKSREIYFSYRFDPGFRHHYIAEWSSLVARRAHNPKVMRFKSHLRNQIKRQSIRTAFLFAFGCGSVLHDLRVMDRRAWLVGRARHKTVNNRFAEAMSRVASRSSRVTQAMGGDTKADRDMYAQTSKYIPPISATFIS